MPLKLKFQYNLNRVNVLQKGLRKLFFEFISLPTSKREDSTRFSFLFLIYYVGVLRYPPLIFCIIPLNFNFLPAIAADLPYYLLLNRKRYLLSLIK